MPGSLSWQAGKSLLTGHTHSAYLIFCLNSFSWHYSASTRPCLTLQNVAEREVPAAVLGVPAPPRQPQRLPGTPPAGGSAGGRAAGRDPSAGPSPSDVRLYDDVSRRWLCGSAGGGCRCRGAAVRKSEYSRLLLATLWGRGAPGHRGDQRFPCVSPSPELTAGSVHSERCLPCPMSCLV